MHQLLNTLYVTTEGAYLRADHDTLRVEVEKETKLQVPFHHLGGVVCFGDVMMSPAAMQRCAEDGRFVVLLDRNGRFKARMEGPVSGNVLLRCAQHEAMRDPVRTLPLRAISSREKFRTTRQIILRGARETDVPRMPMPEENGGSLGNAVRRLPQCETWTRCVVSKASRLESISPPSTA